MDSAGDFYDNETDRDTLVKKSSSHSVKETNDIESGDCGVHLQLQNEDSVDLQAYQDRANGTHIVNSNDELFRQLGDFFTTQQQQLEQEVPAQTLGAPHLFANQVHVEDVEQTMPLFSDTRLVTEQADKSTHIPPSDNYQVMNDYEGTSNTAPSPGMPTASDTMEHQAEPSRPALGPTRRKRPVLDRNSPTYVHKRERNNLAVKKSREKTKEKSRELQDRVGHLEEGNAQLREENKQLKKKLAVYESLFLKKPAADKAVE